MNEIFEQMRKDFNDFLGKADKLIGKYKKEENAQKDIGKLCYFWDDYLEEGSYGLLKTIVSGKYKYMSKLGNGWMHYRRLTPQDVAEITGYEVVDLG